MAQVTKRRDPSRTRLMSLLAFASLLCLLVVGRAAKIQIIGDDRLRAMAKRQFQSKMLVRPRRGLILDRNGQPLAVNAEAMSLAADPSKVENRPTIARLISKALGFPYLRTLERFREKKEFVWIKRHLSEAELNQLKHWHVLGKEGVLPEGLWMVREDRRIYPHGELGAHVLGDVNIDMEGKEGVELWLNERLTGKVASVSAVRDALGRPSFIDATAARQLQDGESVKLTIDASLQYAIEQELRNSVVRTGARSGTVIVMDAVTGEILAMANEPSFNPNDKNVNPARRRNRAVTDGYEPGSTLKAILLAGALEHGSKLTDTIFGENGSFMVQGRKISEAEAHERFQWITLKRMIQVSSNVAAAKLAMKLGPENYSSTLKQFGIGGRSDMGFPGEISGRVPPIKEWKPLTTATIGFGQGLLVTPIQMIRAYAALANGGWLVQPVLLKNQLDGQQGEKSDQGTRAPPKRILSERVVSQVTDALQSVTTGDGTGVKAAVEGYEIAGKTGTAQVVDPATGKYSRTRYMPSFIGYSVGLERKIVVFAALDDPKGAYYAAETAAPLFRASFLATANRLSMPAKASPLPLVQQPGARPALSAVATETRRAVEDTKRGTFLQDQLKLSIAKATEPEINRPEATVDENGIRWKVPALVGLTAREALQSLMGHGFEVEMSGQGFVKSQWPEAGKAVANGETVRLVLSPSDPD